MATVRLNDGIRGSIESNLRRLFQPRKEALAKEWQKLDLQEIIYKFAKPKEDVEVLKQLDVKWVSSATQVRLRVLLENGTTYDVNVGNGKPLRAPIALCDRGYHVTCIVDVPPDSPEGQQLLDIRARTLALNAEEEALLKGPIMTAVKECSTLKQLLEVWPSALDFVSEDIRRKHAEQSVPAAQKQKVQLEALAIPDDVKVQLISARMTSQ